MHTFGILAAIFVAASALLSVDADFAEVRPTAFPKDDPRTKGFARMMDDDARARMRGANLRESKAFAEVKTKGQWETYRDERLRKLRESLGSFPEAPKALRIEVTRKLGGDGFTIHNLVYESRPGLWVTANLYLPAKPPAKMPGILIAHSHHSGKTSGELQDMGMTWARSGSAVLIPDALGYGERRQHEFNSAMDNDKPFRVGRQDYFFRYNSNLQLASIGDSLIGWMVWDLMRGVDVLLRQTAIDKDRIILLGAVAGGGDPAGVTAALDGRIACAVPFNFGGWQPESAALENPDRDFAWFGEGYWESTRGLRDGARDGFAHFAIFGGIAPRKVIYTHEFAWDGKRDPAWPRLQKIFGFYGAEASLRVAHGSGSVKGKAPESSHCDHIGAVHRKMIYPALKEWFGMPVPEEYSKRRPAADLLCWTDEARKELKPKALHEVVAGLAEPARLAALKPAGDDLRARRQTWAKLLGNVEPVAEPKATEGMPESVPGGTLLRIVLETDPGISMPVIALAPKGAKGKAPAAVMVASGGKAGFLKERGTEIAALLDAGIAVYLVDVRGTGETRPGSSADRGSHRTSISQTNAILGQPLLGAQLRDLRTVIGWLRAQPGIDGKKLAVWGDSFAGVNATGTKLAVPLDLDGLAVSEPGGANLALLAGLYEDVAAVYASGGLATEGSLAGGPYLYVPHDGVIPAPVQPVESVLPVLAASRVPMLYANRVDAQNRAVGKRSAGGSAWVIEKLVGK